MKCSFLYSHYIEMLKLAKEKGYKILPLKDYNSRHKKVIYLRHDVDCALDKAFVMSRIEWALGIRSSYFILLHGNFNIFTTKNLRRIKGIGFSNHEIGLHYFDMGIPLQTEKKILQSVVEQKIKGFCCHEPTRCGGFNMKEKGMYNAYEPKFLKNMKYISESGARWREGCLCEYIGKVDKICVLMHPEHWYRDSPLERF